jgi:predicted TIM-barrel fold metal-dependent hydrolase
VDTSGTNNWMDYHVPKMTLAEVFERALTALGPERVLFGTDSGTTAPYREWIKFQQVRTLEEIGLSDRDRDLVLRGNAVRIFGMDEAPA